MRRSLLRTTFSALRERDFALFFSGQVLSLTGTWMERAALASLVYRLSAFDERWLAIIGLVPLFPVLVVSMPAGALADRVPLLRLVLATQILMMTAAAGMTLLVASGDATPFHVAVYAAIASALFAVDAPARQALVPRLVERRNLTNAIALGAVSFNAARLVGGVGFWAVVTATSWGEAGCLALNVVSFGAVIAGLVLIRTHPPVVAAGERPQSGFADGLRYAWATPVVRGALLVVLATSFLGFQVSHLLPVYAEKVWDVGRGGLGSLHAWFGAGALAGGLLLATRSGHVHRGRLIFLCGAAAAVLLATLASMPSFLGGCIVLAACGFVLIQMHSASNAVIQSNVPDALRGRVMSLFTLSVLGAFPLGGLAAGFSAKAFGAPATTFASAVLVGAAVAAIRATHRDLARVV